MSYIKLCDIGKIYAGDSGIAVGIRSVNLSFDRGEFVAITGQSGSGKSTLLNIISGMDTYEEGEMFIEGEPTSHYIQQDFEEYRKKYISFIFQDYNIIESFTVLENVELALMHIDNRKERRKKALELLERVGMKDHLRHRGSQLSGGQKQRTVIARALAKDSPVILADEPTGNLDSKTSEEIIKLLHEVSKDKLVIIVTHNFEEVEKYATRHIRVFDGGIEFDRTVKDSERPISDASVINSVTSRKKLVSTLKNGATLGRVRFFSMPKLTSFICILMVFSCIAITLVTSLYGEALELFDKNYLFTHVDGRVVIMRNDGAVMTEEELQSLVSRHGAVDHMQCDYLIDERYSEFAFTTDNIGKPDIGRYPESDNEVLLYLPIYNQPEYGKDTILIDSAEIIGTLEFDIVGIKYYYDNNLRPIAVVTENGYDIATAVAFYNYNLNTTAEINLSNMMNSSSLMVSNYEIYLSFDLEEDEYYVYGSEFDNYINEYENSLKNDPSLTYTCNLSMTSSVIYNYYYGGYYDYMEDIGSMDSDSFSADLENCRSRLDELDDFDAKMNLYGVTRALVLSPLTLKDYVNNNYFVEKYNQSSLFFKNDKAAEKALNALDADGYTAVMSNTEIALNAEEYLLSALLLFISAFTWVIAIVFISIFMALCSSKAMNATSGDIAVLRTMGIPVSVIKISIYVQTMIAIIPAYALTALCAYLIFTTPITNGVFIYLYSWQYALIALGLVLAVIMLSHRYVKRIFGTTVKKSLKGGGLK